MTNDDIARLRALAAGHINCATDDERSWAIASLCDEVKALRSIARDVAEAYPDLGNGAHDACRKAPCIGCRARRALAGGQ